MNTDSFHDEVDAVVQAWGRERPDLDASIMHIWSRITRLAQVLDDLRSDAYRSHKLQAWEFDVLAALRRSGEPYELTPGQLMKDTHVTSGTMTNRVDRLSERGLVTRKPNPLDGRGVIVQLTAQGRERVEAALIDLIHAERELTSVLSPGEIADLSGQLRSLLVHCEQDGYIA